MDQLNSTVETFNLTTSPGLLPQPNWYSSHLVPAVVLSICFILGVPGNIAVIILRPNWQHLSSLSQTLMLNLAVSDLICLLILPAWIHALLNGWTFGLVSCKLLVYVVNCSMHGSHLTVTGLSVQRYLMVVHQRNFRQVRKRLLLVLLWLVAFLGSIPAVVVLRLDRFQQWKGCQPVYSSDAQRVAVLMIETLLVFLFLSIVVFSYICVQRKISQAAFFNNPQTTRLITSIIVSFFVLWLPLLMINMLGLTAVGLNDQTLLRFYTEALNIVVALTFINRCLHPLLYAFTSWNFCTVCLKKEPRQQNPRTLQTQDITTTAEL